MLLYPRLTAKDIVSVQHMTAPVGLVFYYDCTYGQQQPNLNNNDIFALKPMSLTTLEQIKNIKVQNCDSVEELLENLTKLHELITQKYQSEVWFTHEELNSIGSKFVLAANFGTKNVVSSAKDQEKISDKLLEIENFFYGLPCSFFFDDENSQEASERNKQFTRVAIEAMDRSILRPNNTVVYSKGFYSNTSGLTSIQYKFLRYHFQKQEVGLKSSVVNNFLRNHGVFISSLMLFELTRNFATRFENRLKVQAYQNEAVAQNKKIYPRSVAARTEPVQVPRGLSTIGLVETFLEYYECELHAPDPKTMQLYLEAQKELLRSEQMNLATFKPAKNIDNYIAQVYMLVQLMKEHITIKNFEKRKELASCLADFLKSLPFVGNDNDFKDRDISEVDLAVELLEKTWTNYELLYKEHEFKEIADTLLEQTNRPETTNFNDLRKQQKELFDKTFSKEEQKEIMAAVFANNQAEKDAKELVENIKKVNEQILKTTVKSVDKPIQLTFDFAEPIKLESVPIVATKKKLDAKWEITNVLSFSDLKKQIESLELTQDVIQPKHEDKIKLPYLKPTFKSVQQILPLLSSIKYHKELFVTEVMDKEKGNFAIQQLYSFLVFCVWDDYPKAEQDQVKQCLSELDNVIFERACENTRKKGLFEEDVTKQTVNLINSFKDLEESLWYERKLNEGKPDTVIPQCSPKILVPLLKDLKQLPDNDSIVENNKIFKEVARYIVDGKLSCIFYGDKETEEVYNWYLDTFFPNQFDHLFTKKVKNQPEKKPSLSSTTDDDVAYRIAVKQLLSLTQDWLVNEQFKKNKESALAFFKTDLGLAVVASTVLTLAASRFPKKHLERLSRELRVSTLALAGNETVQMLQDFFKKAEPTLAIESTIPLLEQKEESSRGLAVVTVTTSSTTNATNAV